MKKMRFYKALLTFAVVFIAAFSLNIGTQTAHAAVRLNKTKVELVKGTSYKLQVTGTSKPISWKSSSSVATIKKVTKKTAKITAKNAGSATITMKVGKVQKKVKVKVVSARLNRTSVNTVLRIYPSYLVKDLMPESIRLRVSGAEVDEWESSNPDVAKVGRKGLVTPKAVGKTTITAHVGDSELTCKFTVRDPHYDGSKYCIDSGKDGIHLSGGRDILVKDGKFISEEDLELSKAALLGDPMVRKFYDEYLEPGMNDVQKVFAILQFYEDLGVEYGSVDYDPSTGCEFCRCEKGWEGNYHQTAHAVFYGREAVCNGFAKATEFLCIVADVPCFYVNQDAPLHAYNVIQIQGQWYNFDTTGGGAGSTSQYALALNDNYLVYFLNWDLTVDDYKDTWGKNHINVAKGYLRYQDKLPVICREHIVYSLPYVGENLNGHIVREGDIAREVYNDDDSLLSYNLWYSAASNSIVDGDNETTEPVEESITSAAPFEFDSSEEIFIEEKNLTEEKEASSGTPVIETK